MRQGVRTQTMRLFMGVYGVAVVFIAGDDDDTAMVFWLN